MSGVRETNSEKASRVNAASKRQRRPYEAPMLASVDLEAEQVLDIGCKTQSAGGGPTNACDIAGPCNTQHGS